MADPTGKTPVISTSTQQFIIALCIVGIAGTMLWVLAHSAIPEKNIQMLNLALGSVLTIMGGVFAFFFPSSVGARSKDEAISNLASQIASSPATTVTSTTTTKKDPFTIDAGPTIANTGTVA